MISSGAARAKRWTPRRGPAPPPPPALAAAGRRLGRSPIGSNPSSTQQRAIGTRTTSSTARCASPRRVRAPPVWRCRASSLAAQRPLEADAARPAAASNRRFEMHNLADRGARASTVSAPEAHGGPPYFGQRRSARRAVLRRARAERRTHGTRLGKVERAPVDRRERCGSAFAVDLNGHPRRRDGRGARCRALLARRSRAAVFGGTRPARSGRSDAPARGTRVARLGAGAWTATVRAGRRCASRATAPRRSLLLRCGAAAGSEGPPATRCYRWRRRRASATSSRLLGDDRRVREHAGRPAIAVEHAAVRLRAGARPRGGRRPRRRRRRCSARRKRCAAPPRARVWLAARAPSSRRCRSRAAGGRDGAADRAAGRVRPRVRRRPPRGDHAADARGGDRGGAARGGRAVAATEAEVRWQAERRDAEARRCGGARAAEAPRRARPRPRAAAAAEPHRCAQARDGGRRGARAARAPSCCRRWRWRRRRASCSTRSSSRAACSSSSRMRAAGGTRRPSAITSAARHAIATTSARRRRRRRRQRRRGHDARPGGVHAPRTGHHPRAGLEAAEGLATGAKLDAAFAQFDADRNGRIDAGELGQALEMMDIGAARHHEHDATTRHGGTLDRPTFGRLIVQIVASQQSEAALVLKPERYQAVFNKFDVDASGSIDASELEKILDAFGLTRDACAARTIRAYSRGADVLMAAVDEWGGVRASVAEALRRRGARDVAALAAMSDEGLRETTALPVAAAASPRALAAEEWRARGAATAEGTRLGRAMVDAIAARNAAGALELLDCGADPSVDGAHCGGATIEWRPLEPQRAHGGDVHGGLGVAHGGDVGLRGVGVGRGEPLRAAAACGLLDVIDALVAAGADVGAADRGGTRRSPTRWERARRPPSSSSSAAAPTRPYARTTAAPSSQLSEQRRLGAERGLEPGRRRRRRPRRLRLRICDGASGQPLRSDRRADHVWRASPPPTPSLTTTPSRRRRPRAAAVRAARRSATLATVTRWARRSRKARRRRRGVRAKAARRGRAGGVRRRDAAAARRCGRRRRGG